MSLYNYFLTYKDDVVPTEQSIVVMEGGYAGRCVSTPVTINPETGDIDTPGILFVGENLTFSTPSARIYYESGANAAAGVVTLVGGTATVSSGTTITANSKIKLSRMSIGATGAAATGNLVVGTITPGVSFVINSVNPSNATALVATDVSQVYWEISELVS